MEDANSYTQVLSFTASLVHILATVVRTASSVCSTCSDHRSVAAALLLDGRREVIMVAALLFTRREEKQSGGLQYTFFLCSVHLPLQSIFIPSAPLQLFYPPPTIPDAVVTNTGLWWLPPILRSRVVNTSVFIKLKTNIYILKHIQGSVL
ncbi:hypothetical protein CHARACLAT_027136 [Characodon lateralis]|uniref:Uncharacterized protein n=1 Tax=Characodon lateralis TaxID=208331 RepID=A0ABU7DN82_9TELE|nr:hypothetical protein [Characodon lateralis]